MTDRSDAISREVRTAIGQATSYSSAARVGGPSGWEAFQALMARDDVLEIMAAAHDAEESAQKGEPSLWTIWLQGDWQGAAEDWEEFKAERRAAMLCALRAVGLA